MILSLLQILTMVSEESAGAKIAILETQLCRKHHDITKPSLSGVV